MLRSIKRASMLCVSLGFKMTSLDAESVIVLGSVLGSVTY